MLVPSNGFVLLSVRRTICGNPNLCLGLILCIDIFTTLILNPNTTFNIGIELFSLLEFCSSTCLIGPSPYRENLPQWLKEKHVSTHCLQQSKLCFNIATDEANNNTWLYINQVCSPATTGSKEGEAEEVGDGAFLLMTQSDTEHILWASNRKPNFNLKLCSHCTSWSVWRKTEVLCDKNKKHSFPRTVQSACPPGSTGLFSEIFEEKNSPYSR